MFVSDPRIPDVDHRNSGGASTPDEIRVLVSEYVFGIEASQKVPCGPTDGDGTERLVCVRRQFHGPERGDRVCIALEQSVEQRQVGEHIREPGHSSRIFRIEEPNSWEGTILTANRRERRLKGRRLDFDVVVQDEDVSPVGEFLETAFDGLAEARIGAGRNERDTDGFQLVGQGESVGNDEKIDVKV